MRDLNSLNRVILVGNLVKKPELRYLPKSNRAVASFQVATNESVYHPDSNQTSKKTEFHRIVTWGKLAEFCNKYLDQGRQVLIEGKLRNRSWEGRDGNKRYVTEVEAQNVVLLGRRPSATEEMPAGAQMADFSADDFPDLSEPAGDQFPEEGGGEDDIPF
ncbi:MAG TPA: single-stranded DNA-binding protein [Candidatus Saccharicenans sp.]|jgi:single-strand DNA-binding protein|nr:single-stranded DNA-binding protein [Candidatus Saccharicenans sp.]